MQEEDREGIFNFGGFICFSIFHVQLFVCNGLLYMGKDTRELLALRSFTGRSGVPLGEEIWNQ